MPVFHNLAGTTSESFSLAKGTKKVSIRTNNGIIQIQDNAGYWRDVARKTIINASNPTINDDANDGYLVGDKWFQSTINIIFICEDNTVGAAVWTLADSIVTGTSFPTGIDGLLFWHNTNEILYLYSSTASAWIDLTSSGATNIVGRNVIINGDMRIAQRGTSFAAIANATYSLDRWKYSKVTTGAVHTVTQDSSMPTNQFSNCIKLDCTTADAAVAAGDLLLLQQYIEGFNFKKFIGQLATFSFWIKAGKTGTMCVSFVNSGTDRSYVAEVTINAANTWEKKTVSLTFDYSGGTWDYTNGIGLRVSFALIAGSTYQTTANAWQTGAYYATANQTNFVDNADSTCDVYITGVQLELGNETDFEFLSIKDTLVNCQRYYEQSYDLGTAPGTITDNGSFYQRQYTALPGFIILFKVIKRSTPVVIAYSNADGEADRIRVAGVNYDAEGEHEGQMCACITKASTLTIADNYIQCHWTADSEL